jgi:predicted MFS family arabinose efflux permease
LLTQLLHRWRSAYTGLPRTIWLLAFVNLVNRCGGMVVAFISLYLTEELHFSLPQAGYVLGCFGAGALAGAFFGGRLTDRMGYYPVQLWSLILNGLVLIGLLWVHDFWAMCAAIFILSTVGDAFRPANAVAIARHSTADTRTRSISLMRMAFNMGWTLAPALGGLIAHTLGWSWLFWIDGLTCILAAGLLLWLIPPQTTDDKKTARAAQAAVVAEQSPYRDRQFLTFMVLNLLGALVFMQMIWTVPVFFKQGYHWDEGRIGAVLALNGLLVFLIEMPLIFRLEGRRTLLYFVRFGLLMYALAFICFFLPAGNTWLPALSFMVFISIGEIFVMPFSSNYVYGRAMSKGSSGQYMGVYGMSYSLANIIAPLLSTQIIAAWGYPTLWYLLIALAALAWSGFWWLERRTTVV